jgi:plastocyanin domain-containing protein
MDRTIAAAIAVIIVAVAAMLILNPTSAGVGNAQKITSAGSTTPSSGAPAAGTGNTQTINLGFAGNQYSPAEIRVKQGTKVRIVADPTTLTGCMTTVNIDGYGISKYIGAGDNVIEFTADKAGTFPIHCNMGMGNGRLIVEDSSGSVPVQSQAPAVAKGSGGCC